MKIGAIRGKNLASLEGEFEIDFTVEPLKSAGIFAITGSTGSGKSTLLDALCLALFDDTPRIHRASENNVQIVDVKDRTINQKDSRNLLRRGTAEGYAEVDFVSLGGEKFRSRWSVRRSRGKSDGTLQSSELKLTNLTAHQEEPGRKTELLTRITELIGLTFEQFTRAVLLAQGDFATFLKATQKEKAELLEKLTGTEVYSRISAAIYERSKNVEQELNAIRERIREVELLSDEEMAKLAVEKDTLGQEMDMGKKAVEILTQKLKWLVDESVLKDGIGEAERRLANATKAIEDAGPRYFYLSQVDGVQEIRDSFHELKTSGKQLDGSRSYLAEQEKLRDANVLLLEKSTRNVALCEKTLLEHNEKFESIEPKIRQARALDVRMAGAENLAKEAKNEYRQAEERQVKLKKFVAETQTAVDAGQKTISKLTAWFEQHQAYREIIPRIDLIVNLLDDAAAATKQEAINRKTLDGTNALLDAAATRLTELTKESERLNKLLPAEIAALRLRLEEGKPCPVCGSEHHPHSRIGGESLEEEALNVAKEEVANQMAILSGRMENLRNENIRLASVIENYARQSKEAIDKLDVLLVAFPDWKTKLAEGHLPRLFQSVAGTWRKNESLAGKANEQAASFQTGIQLAKEQLVEAEEMYTSKEGKFKEAKETLEKLREERTGIFGGKTSDEVEKLYIERRKSLSEELSRLKEERNNILAAKEKQEGVIQQVAREIAKLSVRCDALKERVDQWMLSGREITIERLSDLLSKDQAWITAEREQLNRLHQNKTTAWATLNERKKTLEHHHLLENKPAEEETQEVLRKTLADSQELIRRRTARATEIEILWDNHWKGKKRIAVFEKEWEEKSALSGNWKKLNEMFGAADGAKFKVLAQGYTLDALLAYANKHLRELSKRYEIQRVPDTLALQVIDLDMLGEVRTVHSLSGGESFLISLSLALGLSSLSSNRMKVESLFIDEGFGSLDADTLRIAMDALERLQTQGRKIGVISHVTEMTERVGVRIRIVKSANGRSRILL
ncbi:MAG: AAA family ATPase [Tannerellaceae bacterium]|jgi:exonuclease SbcC|nr:AAA family ATPase [Tannerellaceae bacterium]